jgi:hypothetical protein
MGQEMIEFVIFTAPTLLIGLLIYWATRKVKLSILVMAFSLALFVCQYFLVARYSIPYLSRLLGNSITLFGKLTK